MLLPEQREALPITDPAYILLLGPSGAGKSAIIERITQMDPRITPTTVYTDRPAREKDFGRQSISPREMDVLHETEEFITFAEAFGNRLGVLKRDVVDAMRSGKIPVQDYTEHLVGTMRGQDVGIHAIYIVPPTLGTLKSRLAFDNRDPDGLRFQRGREELLALVRKRFKSGNIDDIVINKDLDKASRDVLESIYRRVCR